MSDLLFNFLSCVPPVRFKNTTKTTKTKAVLASTTTLVYVSGNWYDEFKISTLIDLANKFPKSKLIVSGGIGRLTLPSTAKMGGEPIYLQKRLIEKGIDPRRIVLCNSSIVTTHNVKFLLYYLQQCCDMERWNGKNPRLSTTYQIFVVDESFLLRRLKATVVNALEEAKKSKILPTGMISEITFVSSGSSSNIEMIERHKGGNAIAAYLQIGEWNRLHDYSSEGGLELFTKEQAFDGMKDKLTEQELLFIEKDIQRLQTEYNDDINKILEMNKKKDFKSNIQLLETTKPVIYFSNSFHIRTHIALFIVAYCLFSLVFARLSLPNEATCSADLE